MSNPLAGDLRLVLALFDVFVRDSPTEGRLQVAPNVVLASLNEAEGARVAERTGERHPARWRLEIYGVQGGPKSYADLVRHHLQMLSLAVRVAPRNYGANVDTFDGEHWVRARGTVSRPSGARRGLSNLRLDRLETWGRLLTERPRPSTWKGMELALSSYYDSIVARQEGQFNGSFLAASMAFEILLGPGLREELRYRLSVRGALLVAQEEAARSVFRWLRSCYDMRSSLIHAGVSPAHEDLIRLQQYLMRAIPTMLALSQLLDGHERAVQVLDDAAFTRAGELDQLMGNGWWAYVPSDWLDSRLK